ncbi:Splicing factor 3B subunit 5/RDS3 complex subunit 10 - like 2 [Theobroma cacao]|nr:Splicing factor 3B subunit 5/RDS3 complex subunit 10 - like 2 [Theobroma cacao]
MVLAEPFKKEREKWGGRRDRKQDEFKYSYENPLFLASDRFNINSQLKHLQAKYVGMGHADINRFYVQKVETSKDYI